MVSLNLGLLVQNDDLEIKFQILCVFLVFKISNDFLRLYEVYVDNFEEIHSNLRFLFQNPIQFLKHFRLILKLYQQFHCLLICLVSLILFFAILSNELPALKGLI